MLAAAVLTVLENQHFALGNDMKLYQHFSAGRNRTGILRADSHRRTSGPASSLPWQHYPLTGKSLPFGSVMDNPGAARSTCRGVQGADFQGSRIKTPRHSLLPAGHVRFLACGHGLRVRPGPVIWAKAAGADQHGVPAQSLHHRTGCRCGEPKGGPRCQCSKRRASVICRRSTHHSTLRPAPGPVHGMRQKTAPVCNRIVTAPHMLSVPKHSVSAVRLWDYICVFHSTSRSGRPAGADLTAQRR